MWFLDNDEKAKQANWEAEYMGDEIRAPLDHIREHDIACWNSMFAPQIYHPTILRPLSGGWEVEIIVRIQRAQGPRMTIIGHIHPNSCFSKVARYVIFLVNPTGDLRLNDVIEVEETGQHIKPEWGRNLSSNDQRSTIASSTLNVPVLVNYNIREAGRL